MVVLSRGCKDIFNYDVFSVVNVYHDHLKLCVVCIYGRRYVCCGSYNVVSNECYEPTPFIWVCLYVCLCVFCSHVGVTLFWIDNSLPPAFFNL